MKQIWKYERDALIETIVLVAIGILVIIGGAW